MKKLIIFDLDGTLAPSKSFTDNDTAKLIESLLRVQKVAIISGGAWEQFQKQVLSKLPKKSNIRNLSILPTCGTKFYKFNKKWVKLYSEDFSEEEKNKIIDSLNAATTKAGYKAKKVWGELIEDRGSQITYSALGQKAPLEAKEKYDPDFKKRKKIKLHLDKLLKGYSVRLGGMTSIDVTKPGIDKAYGIKKLHSILKIKISEMMFVGDAIFPGGNDYPAKQAGVSSIRVKDPEATKVVINTIISYLH